MLKRIEHTADAVDISKLVQPVRMKWNGTQNGPLPTDGASSIDDASLFHYIHSETYYAYFAAVMSEFENAINSANHPNDLQLSDKFILPFLSDAHHMIDGEEKCICRVGPIKSPTRATIKARSDYSDRPTSMNGHVVNPADYVLDWLRATFVAEDPLVLAAVHAIIEEGKLPMLSLVRTKNNIEKRSRNILCNVHLLYPPNADTLATFKDGTIASVFLNGIPNLQDALCYFQRFK